MGKYLSIIRSRVQIFGSSSFHLRYTQTHRWR